MNLEIETLAQELLSIIDDAGRTKIIPEGLKLFPHQPLAVATLMSKKRYLLADDPGLGKTIELTVAANALAALAAPKVFEVLILCPKSMLITWQRETKKWGMPGVNWTITNWDTLVGRRSGDYYKNWDIIIADESHKAIKNEKAIRCKVFFELIEYADKVWLATATPASRSALDYYCTLKILLPKLMEKVTSFGFQKQFCNKVADPWSPLGFKFEGFKNTEQLGKILSHCHLRRKKSEVDAGLPELTFSNRYLTGKFESFSPDEVSEIKAAVRSGVVLGSSYQGKLQALGISKIPECLDLVENYPVGTKLVLFGWHTLVLEKLAEQINNAGRSVGVITGQTSGVERQRLMDSFQEGPLEVLCCNVESGGVGITLTAASTAIYVQVPTSAASWVQSLNRIHRIGSKHNVEIIRLMAQGAGQSIDEAIYEMLEERLEKIAEVGV